MKVKISHLAILVSSVDEVAKKFSDIGLEVRDAEVFAGEGSRERYIGTYKTHCALPLLVEPHGAGPYQSAMDRRGPGIHHFSIDVENFSDVFKQIEGTPWRVLLYREKHSLWLAHSGMPLIEIQESVALPDHRLIEKVFMPITPEQLKLLALLGLADAVEPGEFGLLMKGKKLSLSPLI